MEKIDKKQIIGITNRLYRLTLLFPKKEPLRYRIREIANNILADSIALNISKSQELVFNMEKNLEILNTYFEVAKWQNWVSYFDILSIEKEYDRIRQVIEKKEDERIVPILLPPNLNQEKLPQKPIIIEEKQELKEKKQEKPVLIKKTESLNSRKEKILEVLREKGKVQVWEISRILPDVSKRTLRRDFVQLLDQELIERIGQRNDTFYQLRK